MSYFNPVLDTYPYLDLPTLFGWVVWLAILGLTGYGLYAWRRFQPAWKGRMWGILISLLVSVLVANMFFGIRLFLPSALPLPEVPTGQYGAAFLPLSALPWMLGGGLVSPLGAAILGLATGILRGLWDTRNLFTLLELALFGVLFAASVRQRYRTPIFRLLRQPLSIALALIPLHAVFYVVGVFFTIQGEAPVKLDYALSNLGMTTLAFAGEMLVGGLIAQIVALAFPSAWGERKEAQPSPVERSLEARFLFGTSAFILLLLITLLVGTWIVAGSAARRLLQERMSSTAEISAQSVPFFLETGQNLAEQIAANPRLRDAGDDELSRFLGEQIQAVPYFNQVFVVDANTRAVLGCYPAAVCQSLSLFPAEDAGLMLAGEVPSQIYSIPPLPGSVTARVTFLSAIRDETGRTVRVLLGRTDLGINPLTQPLIQSLGNMSASRGMGILLDENGQVVYHPDPAKVMTGYTGQRGDQVLYYDETASDGTRQIVYYQPALGRSWAIVLVIPAQQTQQLALNIALPLSLMIVGLALLALIFLRYGLRVITGSLQNLAVEANRIAQGQLNSPLQIKGEDEVGQLGQAFEQMRISLQARLDELNRLLSVSRGVASTLRMDEAVMPVLEAALASGPSAVRVVLAPEVIPDSLIEAPSQFAIGPSKDSYAHLDDQVLALAEQQDRIVLANSGRARALILDEKAQNPASIMAVALRHKNRYYGALWVAYDTVHAFSEGEVRFISTLGGQAALAASNAYLFMNVEVSRRQLEAILNSTPDPVLVIDPRNYLILANRAAVLALGPNVSTGQGKRIERVVTQQPLLELLLANGEKQSAEVTLADERTYLATASTVVADETPLGRVCIMRDVTHFKELDALKSDFVATVSHDLRSPLTLIRGYATMMNMAGSLNDQQQGYVNKIVTGVENMTRLVNNLLDLGRIELGVGLEVEPVSPLDILERIVSALQLQANQKDISLSLELSKDLPDHIEADPALLYQAVYNLIENAIKYTPEGGQVYVRLYVRDGIVFEIKDTGIGISSEDMTRLFEKFYRGKTREARARHGTGLGLAIVRSIAERHGGRVWVDSREGVGSTFYLQIPVTQ